MTSSLVGSEMCIRDSRGVDQPILTTRKDFAPFMARPVLTPTVSSAISVSYTHLTLPTICSV
eukprot:10882314-Prorocentrum_lima.AAC.1